MLFRSCKSPGQVIPSNGKVGVEPSDLPELPRRRRIVERVSSQRSQRHVHVRKVRINNACALCKLFRTLIVSRVGLEIPIVLRFYPRQPGECGGVIGIVLQRFFKISAGFLQLPGSVKGSLDCATAQISVVGSGIFSVAALDGLLF